MIPAVIANTAFNKSVLLRGIMKKTTKEHPVKELQRLPDLQISSTRALRVG